MVLGIHTVHGPLASLRETAFSLIIQAGVHLGGAQWGLKLTLSAILTPLPLEIYQALCHPHPARLPPSLFLKTFPFPLEDISTYSTARISLPHTESRSLRNQRMYLSTENTLQAIQQLDTFTATQSNKDVGSFYRTQRESDIVEAHCM